MWLALSGTIPDCTPASVEHPLVEPEKAKADPRLEGTWASRNSDGTEVLMRVATREGAKSDAALLGAEVGKGVSLLSYEIFPAAVGGKTYLNVREKKYSSMSNDKYELLPGYMIVRYELKGDVLNLSYLVTDAALKSGLHKSESDLITDDPAALSAYLAKADAAAWSSFSVMKRQKLDFLKEPAKKK